MNNKILVLGDMHLKDRLSYADYVEDGRQKEKDDILNFIVGQAKDCTQVVFMGDNLHSRSNSPHVIKELTNFIERLDDKEVFIISGNHESFATGQTAIDYLKEIKGKNWHVITDETASFGILSFCPFFTKSELGTNDNEAGAEEIMKRLKPGEILFHHHAVADCIVGSGTPVDNFPEPVLPRAKLEKRFKLIVGGHIHSPQVRNRTIVTGSVFTNEVGELEKFIWKVNPTDFTYEQIKLPCRPIYKLEIFKDLPAQTEWDKFDKNGIIKTIIKEKKTEAEIDELKKKLSEFSAYVLLEQVPHERKKLHYDEGQALLEFSTEQLLEVYAKDRGVPLELLKKGFELIRI